MSLKSNHKRPYKREEREVLLQKKKQTVLQRNRGEGGFKRLLLTLKMGKGPEAKECSSQNWKRQVNGCFPWRLC